MAALPLASARASWCRLAFPIHRIAVSVVRFAWWGLDYDYTPPDMGGWDAVHALLSAISVAASLLDDFVLRGGRVFYPDTETPYDFEDLKVDFRAGPGT